MLIHRLLSFLVPTALLASLVLAPHGLEPVQQRGFEYDTGVFAVFQPKVAPKQDISNPNLFTVEYNAIPSAFLWRQEAASPPFEELWLMPDNGAVPRYASPGTNNRDVQKRFVWLGSPSSLSVDSVSTFRTLVRNRYAGMSITVTDAELAVSRHIVIDVTP